MHLYVINQIKASYDYNNYNIITLYKYKVQLKIGLFHCINMLFCTGEIITGSCGVAHFQEFKVIIPHTL